MTQEAILEAYRSPHHTSDRSDNFDVVVCGAGPAGLAAAVCLGKSGLKVAICGERPIDTPENPDLRTAALFTPSISFLQSIGAWRQLSETSQILHGIRIIDDTGAILRAPETTFKDVDAGLKSLGYNCPNPDVVAVLCSLIDNLDTVTNYIGTRIKDVVHASPTLDTSASASDATTVLLSGSDRAEQTFLLTASLIIAADGRRSLTREAANISVRTWDYNQSALTVRFFHTQPHDGISTEFHRPGGPCTVVPLPNNESALVWVDRPGAINRLTQLSDQKFKQALEDQLQGLLGTVTKLSRRRTFPLSGLIAKKFGAQRTALVGDAAHGVPPIGAQGLNMGFRDVAILSEQTIAAHHANRDIGSIALLTQYSERRKLDVTARVYGVDALSASLTSPLYPMALARGAILHAANQLPFLKRQLIEQGLTMPPGLPASMRPHYI